MSQKKSLIIKGHDYSPKDKNQSSKYYNSYESDQDTINPNEFKCMLTLIFLVLLLTIASVIVLGICNVVKLDHESKQISINTMSINKAIGKINELYSLINNELKIRMMVMDTAVNVDIPADISALSMKLTSAITSIEELIQSQTSSVPSNRPSMNQSGGSSGSSQLSNSSRPIPDQGNPNYCNYDKPNRPSMSFTSLNIITPTESAYTEGCHTETVLTSEQFQLVPLNQLLAGDYGEDYCSRYPSLSLRGRRFTYTEERYRGSCSTRTKEAQIIVYGYITDFGYRHPTLMILDTFNPPNYDMIYRCTSVTKLSTGLVICLYTNMTEFELYESPKNTDLIIFEAFDGSQHKGTILNSSKFIYLNDIDMFIPGTGGGIYLNKTIYLPGIVFTTNPPDGNAGCPNSACTNKDPKLCRKGLKYIFNNSYYMVNGFALISQKGRKEYEVTVTMIETDVYHFGSRSRVQYFNSRAKYYQAPNGWFSYPIYGNIYFEKNQKITFDEANYTVYERYTEGSCPINSSCPAFCHSSGYNDIWANDIDSNITFGIYNSDSHSYGRPVFFMANQSGIMYEFVIPGSIIAAGQSTTSCLLFYQEVWCMNVIEIRKTLNSSQEIYGFWTKTPLVCPTKDQYDIAHAFPLPTPSPAPAPSQSVPVTEASTITLIQSVEPQGTPTDIPSTTNRDDIQTITNATSG
ncbi:MAG: glycoprotein [Angavokely henipavirus]|nr:MAG: glycoprotein [Angavokely henipavirus]